MKLVKEGAGSHANEEWNMEEGRNACPFILFLFHLLRSDRWQKKIKNVPYVMTNKSPKTKHYFCRRLSNGFAQFQVSGHKDI